MTSVEKWNTGRGEAAEFSLVYGGPRYWFLTRATTGRIDSFSAITL